MAVVSKFEVISAREGGPASPAYVTKEARLKTFQGWPYGSIQSEEELAEAGFIWQGENRQFV